MPSSRLSSIPPYAFAEVENLVAQLRVQGITPIDFGVGDPIDPTPQFIRAAAKQAIDTYASAGYPSYIGLAEFRQEISNWYQRRSGVSLNPETEISSTIGSKEAIFHFPEGFINPDDIVLMPTPGYPPYKTGTIFAEGIPYQYPILLENDFFPDFSTFPPEILKKARILWLCYPNSPTAKIATPEFYKRAINFAAKNNLIIASDECYLDLYYEEKARSILEFGRDNIIVFHSLSKRSNMTGYRIGFVAGDPQLISIFKQLKTNIDSGTPNFIQAAAIAALQDETHVAALRNQYREKRDLMLNALGNLGLPIHIPEGTFYIWQQVPRGFNSISFAKKLLAPETAIIVTPGEWISDLVNGLNPGQNFVRFALVPNLEQIHEAANRIQKLKL